MPEAYGQASSKTRHPDESVRPRINRNIASEYTCQPAAAKTEDDLLVGGDGCWEVLSREPMLVSRVFRGCRSPGWTGPPSRR